MRDAVSLAVRPPRFGRLDFAEMGRKIELLLPGQRLVRKYDDMMGKERAPDRILIVSRQRPRDIDADDLDRESRREQYKTTDFYSPTHDRGIAWFDPVLMITWPVTVETAIVSDRDRALPPLSEQPDLFEYISA